MERNESVKSSLMRINNSNGQFSLARKECLKETEVCLKDMNHKYNKITFGVALKIPNKNRMPFYFYPVAPQTREESQMWNTVLLTLDGRSHCHTINHHPSGGGKRYAPDLPTAIIALKNKYTG